MKRVYEHKLMIIRAYAGALVSGKAPDGEIINREINTVASAHVYMRTYRLACSPSSAARKAARVYARASLVL